MPEGVVLNVEKRSLDGPAELFVKIAGVAAAPVRPRVAPGLTFFRRAVERQADGEEGPVVVGELETVVALDAGEFGIGQARPDFVLACPGEPAGGFLAQPCSFAADHAVKDSAVALVQLHDYLGIRR
jgi:hypothetical protein